MESPRRILCAECRVGPERPFEREGAMWARCPICGQESRIADIQCEAIEQHIDTAIGAKGGPVPTAPRRNYRWTLCG